MAIFISVNPNKTLYVNLLELVQQVRMADLYPIAFVDEDFKKYKLMELKRKYPNEIEIIPIMLMLKIEVFLSVLSLPRVSLLVS
jgi:hypothetical protein